MNAPGGLWDKLGGVGSAGEGIIIGIVDGGVWPESLSFTDRVDKVSACATGDPGGKLVFQQIPGWHGRCVPGDQFTAANCNQKLIGAQYFNEGWGGNAGHRRISCPGSSTRRVTTAAMARTPLRRLAATITFRPPALRPSSAPISGIAPRARIAAYKALLG